MKAFNVVRKYGRQAAVAATSLLAVPAFAAIDTTELDAAKTDAVTVCTVVFGILVAIAAFKYVRRAL